jgi:anti-sigma factor RsiW
MSAKHKELREMKCKELVELITEYLEGELGAADQARFEQHIAGCDACTAYLEQMRETIAALGRIPPETLSPEAERELGRVFAEWQAR